MNKILEIWLNLTILVTEHTILHHQYSTNTMVLLDIHDDFIKWKHFPLYWPFVRLPVNSPHKGQWRGALKFSLICALNKRLSKQSRGGWFEMPSHSLWRHCNDKWPLWQSIHLWSAWMIQDRCPHMSYTSHIPATLCGHDLSTSTHFRKFNHDPYPQYVTIRMTYLHTLVKIHVSIYQH